LYSLKNRLHKYNGYGFKGNGNVGGLCVFSLVTGRIPPLNFGCVAHFGSRIFGSSGFRLRVTANVCNFFLSAPGSNIWPILSIFTSPVLAFKFEKTNRTIHVKNSVMKQVATTLLLFVLMITAKAQIKISVLPGTAHPAALLELEATNKGLLLPRLNTTAMLDVPADVQSKGLVIYNTDSNRMFLFDGTIWRPIMYSSPVSHWQLAGNSGTNPVTQFIGTTDSVDLAFRTNNLQRFTVKANGLTGIGTSDPNFALDIVNNGGPDITDDISIRTYSNNGGPALLLYRARTIGSVPVNLQNNDFLGILSFRGQVNGNTSNLSRIIASYTGSGTTELSNLSFRTSVDQGMLLNEKGWLTIGNSGQSAQATLDIQGSLRYKATSPLATTYTLTNTDLVVLVNDTFGPNTINLPSGSDFDGHFIIIKNGKNTSVSLSAGSSVLFCNGGGTGCSSLGAQRVIGLVGQYTGSTINWIQVF
jgi:hypothetical protein